MQSIDTEPLLRSVPKYFGALSVRGREAPLTSGIA
jgi:hypothetical protein